MTGKTHHVVNMRLTSERTGDWLVHKQLRPKLVRDARASKTTLTDVVNGILAERYGFAYTASGRRTHPSRTDEVINIRVPIKLWQRVRAAAARQVRKDMDELRAALHEHYGLKSPS